MKKKDIKSFFHAIRNSDFETIVALVSKNKDYLFVTNFAPPKKDDGQSGLQVAFKTGNFKIAKFLIEQGAAVNFKETSEINEWTTPVLHDCIRATIFNCLTMQQNTHKFESAIELLSLMLAHKADPDATDSYGNNCLTRACLDARQMIKHPGFDSEKDTLNQIREVFRLLIDAGANPDLENRDRGNLTAQIRFFGLEEYNLIG